MSNDRMNGIVFSRVRLWAKDGTDCEFYVGGAPECYADIEDHEECIDFREFLEQITGMSLYGIYAHVSVFTEGADGDVPEPADSKDIQRVYTAIADVDIDAITSWTWQKENDFTFDYDAEERLGMGGIK
jgi:hypothetical protein